MFSPHIDKGIKNVILNNLGTPFPLLLYKNQKAKNLGSLFQKIGESS